RNRPPSKPAKKAKAETKQHEAKDDKDKETEHNVPTEIEEDSVANWDWEILWMLCYQSRRNRLMNKTASIIVHLPLVPTLLGSYTAIRWDSEWHPLILPQQ